MNHHMATDVPIGGVMQHVTLNVTVTGVAVWKIRQRVGIWLLKLGALVMGCGIHVELE